MEKELIMEIDVVMNVIIMGTVVLGYVQCEEISVGQKIIIDPVYLPELELEIKGIESYRKVLKVAKRNDYVGIVLGNVSKKNIKKRMKVYLK